MTRWNTPLYRRQGVSSAYTAPSPQLPLGWGPFNICGFVQNKGLNYKMDMTFKQLCSLKYSLISSVLNLFNILFFLRKNPAYRRHWIKVFKKQGPTDACLESFQNFNFRTRNWQNRNFLIFWIQFDKVFSLNIRCFYVNFSA